jgi:hypothetical protein
MTAVVAAASLSLVSVAFAQEQPRIVFKGGRSLPVDALAFENGQFRVLAATEGVAQGQMIRLDLADYVSGEKPAAVGRGVALLLMEKPVEALAQLEPVLVSQKPTAAVQGNCWVETARAAVLAYAMIGNTSKMDALAKELADAVPGAGSDPALALAKALALPPSTKIEIKLTAFGDLLTDDNPVEISAYAAYFRADVLLKAKRNAEALEGFLTVPCLFPTGGGVITGAAELAASDFLVQQSRRDEAIALLNAAARDARGTAVAEEAKKRLESLK